MPELDSVYTGLNLSFLTIGATWKANKHDQPLAESFIRFLEDRRVLWQDRQMEQEDLCVQSVLQIRTRAIECLNEAQGEMMKVYMKKLAAACRRFLDAAGPHGSQFRRHDGWGDVDRFSEAHGYLRASFGFILIEMASAYQVEVEERILPFQG